VNTHHSRHACSKSDSTSRARSHANGEKRQVRGGRIARLERARSLRRAQRARCAPHALGEPLRRGLHTSTSEERATGPLGLLRPQARRARPELGPGAAAVASKTATARCPLLLLDVATKIRCPRRRVGPRPTSNLTHLPFELRARVERHPMSSRRQGPSTIADVLEGTRRATLQRARTAVDRDTWRRAVGPRIADRTEVGQLRDGELTVYVASAAWAQELSLLTREVLERLATYSVKAERIRFRVRPELGAAKAKAGSAKTPEPSRPQPKLPEELQSRLTRVEDDELRGAIAGAAALALARVARPKTEPKARATSAKPAARSPRAAEGRSAPRDQSSVEPHANPRRKRGGPAG